MIVRQLVTRQCCRALFTHGAKRKASQRFLTTEVEQNEALLASHLREAAGMPSTLVEPGITRPRRRRREPPVDPVVESYLISQHMKNTTGQYGTSVTDHYQPHTLLSNPPRPADVTLELLLASQAHLGHSTSLWNPANSRYIFGVREGIHIISLDVTAAHLRRAAKVVSGVAERGGIILFVGTRPGFDRCVVRAAQLSGACHLFERWTPGSITNGQQILGKCRMKVVDEADQEIESFEEQLYERLPLKPDLVVVLNPLENKVLLSECAMANIPTIGIIDTDANPTWVTYPIPANDDSIRCVQVIAGVLGRAGQEGRERRLEAAKNGTYTYLPAEGLLLPNDWEEQQQNEEVAKETNPIRYGTVPPNRPLGPAPAKPTQNSAAAAQASGSVPADQDYYDTELKSIAAKLTQPELLALQQGRITREAFGALSARLKPSEARILLDTVSGGLLLETQSEQMGVDNVSPAKGDADGVASSFYDEQSADEDLQGTSSHLRR